MIRVYKCGNCNGELVYKPGTNEAYCAHCGAKKIISAMSADLANGTFVGLAGQETAESSGDGTASAKCPACGATLPADGSTSATVCVSCGNPAIIESKLYGAYKPSRVVPFTLDIKEAKKKFGDWAKKGPLTPASFKETVANKVQGVYVPFWLYNYDVDVEMSATAENRRTERSGNEERTTTEVYDVYRSTTAQYQLIPQAASDNVPEEKMKIIEPFDCDKAMSFAEPYLLGYTAEKYAKTDAELREKVKEEVRDDATNATKETITGYDEVNVTGTNVSIRNERTEFVLMPVYTVDYRFAGKQYSVFMNGQSGKIAGILPTSKLRGLASFGLGTGITMLICALISFFLIHKMDFAATFEKWWVWLIIGVIAGGITLLITRGKQSGFGKYSRRNYMENKKPAVLQKKDHLTGTHTEVRRLEENK